jgi:hypothetical protein
MWLYELTRVGGQACRPYWRLGLEGRRDLIPRRGPLIVVANHQSFLDPWFPLVQPLAEMAILLSRLRH